jgi:exonuclease III
MYTNADQLSNKMKHLEIAVKCHQPDIICVTEVKPKNTKQPLVGENEIQLKGFSLVSNIKQEGRGVGIYMSNTLTNSKINLSVPYRDSQWLDILSSTGQTMRVGCLRSPSNNEDQNNTLLDVVKSTPPATEIVLCEDYNMKEIDCPNSPCNERDNYRATKFLNTTLDLSLTQHIDKPTRFRHGQSRVN